MRKAFFISLALHLVILAMAYLGLPAVRSEQTPLPEAALSVELVDVGERSNIPPPAQPKADVEPEQKPKPQEQARAPEPVKQERPAPPPAAPAPPPKAEPTPASEPVASPAPKSEPQPAAEPTPVPAFVPKEKAPAPARPAPEPETAVAKAEAKPEAKSEPKPERKAEAKAPRETSPALPAKAKQNEEMDFASVLKSLETSQRKAAPGEKSPGETTTGSAAEKSSSKSAGTAFDASLPVTMSEIDMVRRQIEQCWNLPAGARDAPDLRVTIVVDMNPDGTPRNAVVDDQAQMQASPFFRVAAESALRAVLNPRCHPFKLPREKYERWKTMTLVFDPKEMFGT
jgi:TolA protein